MNKVIVLGGCGAVGSVAVKTLAAQGSFEEVVIGDYDIEKANRMARDSDRGVSAVFVDAEDPKSVQDAVKGCDVVLNCIGPFYKTVKTVLAAVMNSGIDYVDICDDVDVTLEILDWDEKARAAGITALIGMGASPGITNLLGKFAADSFLDETESIDIFHTHGGETVEGEGVIGHRFHCMSIDIPMYLDGELKSVRYFEEDGIALRQEFEFPVVGKVPIFPYPHPEQVTLPRYLKLRQVTNKGSVLPIEYYHLTGELCRLGLAGREPLEVKGSAVVPADFAAAYLIRERERILKETGFGTQRGAMSVVVKGKKEGSYMEYRIHTFSEGAALGEGTGIPAAIGVILMQQGKVNAKGVFPPEGCVNPEDFISLARGMFGIGEKKGGASSGILVEQVDAQGKVTKLDI